MKKIKLIILFLSTIFLFITFTACDDAYKPKHYEHQEIPSVFNENKDMFQQVADIIIKNKSFWNDADIDNQTIRISMDKDKMEFIINDRPENMDRFPEEDQIILQDLFCKTLPYSITLENNRYISISYAIENGPTSCVGFLIYYYDKTSLTPEGETYYDSWKRAVITGKSIDLGNDWFYYEIFR